MAIELNKIGKLARLLFSPEPVLRIDLKLLARCGQFKYLDKFVIAYNSIAFSATPARWDVLNALGDENQCLIIARRCIQFVMVDEALNVKLAQGKLLATAVIAGQPQILMYFAFGVLLLRRIGGLVFRL